MEQRLTEAATGTEIKRYIIGRFQWSEEEFESVNWQAIEQARKGCTKGENIKISKLMFDWVNSGHQKAKMAQEKGCPYFGAEEKTLEHIFQCKDNQMSKKTDENLAVVSKTLKGIKCPDQVICPFFETLRRLCKGEEINIKGKIGRTTAAAIEDEKRIA